MEKFDLEGREYVALCDLMKLAGLCHSGGMAKALIADGHVTVDGEVERRKRCKIRPGKIVEFDGQQVVVE